MSQAKTPKKGRPAPKTNPLAAIISAAVVVAIFVALGFMLSNNSSSEPETAVVPTSEVPQTVPQGEIKQYAAAPPMTIDPSRSYKAVITTPRGDIVIQLRPDLAPQTVNSFVFLARDGFYNGVTWHRVLEGFMAQGGDPEGTGMGGSGYTIPAEFTDQVSFDRPGILAMARPGNDVNGNSSQFFITTAPAQFLDGQYTIFGEVIEGQDIVNGIPLRDPDTNPTTPGEQMLSVTIIEE